MTKTDPLYIPVVRWRSAERDALKQLDESTASIIIPLVEVLPSKVPRYSAAQRRGFIHEVVDQLKEVQPIHRFFVDTSYIRESFLIDGEAPMRELLARGRSEGLALVPCLPLLRTTDKPHCDIFKNDGEREHGLCLRLTPVDLELGADRLGKCVSQLLAHLGVLQSEVDLIMDEQFTYDESASYHQICATIPHVNAWRSFTVISGDFPADLQEFGRGQIHERRRRDWERWQAQTASGSLPRRPLFGDYTVQYPHFRPLPPGEIPNPSVSVRYTTEGSWKICRGEAPREGGPGLEQWHGWAQLLRDLPEYKGPEFSAGDKYIHERANSGSTTGNFTTWISAGINHHITLAAEQIRRYSAA